MTFPVGSAAAPSVNVGGVASGLYRGADFLAVTKSGAPLMLFADSGRIGVGFTDASSMNEEFEVRRTRTDASSNAYGLRSTITFDLAPNSLQFAASLSEAIIPAGNSSDMTGMVRASYSYLRHDGSGTLTDGVANYSILRGNNASVITNAYGFQDSVHLADTASIGTLYHYYANPAVTNGSGTVGTEYGVYVGNITGPVSANRWAIYTAGVTNKVHFTGPVSGNSNYTMAGSAAFRADGTAAAPGFATAGNPNMGMFRSANNVLGWSVSGLSVMTLSASVFSMTGTIRADVGFNVNGTAGVSCTGAPSSITVVAGIVTACTAADPDALAMVRAELETLKAAIAQRGSVQTSALGRTP